MPRSDLSEATDSRISTPRVGERTSGALWQRSAPHLALIAVQLMFGTWPVFGKLALKAFPGVALVALRIAGAALMFALLQRGRSRLRQIRREDYGRLALCSLFGIVLNQLLFIEGLARSTAINATLLGTAIPIFTLLTSVALGAEKLTLSKAFGIALAAVGVIYLVDPTRSDFSAHTISGDALLIANTIFYGSYIVLAQDLIRRYGALTVTALIFLLANLVTAPFGIYHLAGMRIAELDLSIWLVVLYIVLVPTVGAYYLNSWALARVAPSSVAVYIYLQPLVAFAISPFMLGERPNRRAWVAMLLIFAGVAIVTRAARSRVVDEISECPDAFGH